jgi:hypothetical protein
MAFLLFLALLLSFLVKLEVVTTKEPSTDVVLIVTAFNLPISLNLIEPLYQTAPKSTARLAMMRCILQVFTSPVSAARTVNQPRKRFFRVTFDIYAERATTVGFGQTDVGTHDHCDLEKKNKNLFLTFIILKKLIHQRVIAKILRDF